MIKMIETLKEICLRATRLLLIKGIPDGTPQSKNQIVQYFFHYQAQRITDWKIFTELMKIMFTFMINFTWYDGNKSILIKNGIINYLRRETNDVLHLLEIKRKTLHFPRDNIIYLAGKKSSWIWIDRNDHSMDFYGGAYKQAGAFNIKVGTLQMKDWTSRKPNKRVRKLRRDRALLRTYVFHENYLLRALYDDSVEFSGGIDI